MSVKRYRKKPVVIEAMRVPQPGYENRAAAMKVLEWLSAGGCRFTMPPDGICIQTLEGDMLARFGDYIIREPFATDDRKFYPCKTDIFEATYEAVE